MAAHSPRNAFASRHDEADARAFDTFAREQDAVALQAATWATRRQEGLSAADEADFQRWCQADPHHAQAFEAMQTSMARVRALPAAARARLMPTPPVAPSRSAATASSSRRQWLRGAALAGGAFVAVGAGWLGWQQWQQQVVFAQDFAAARGQRRGVALPDGSKLDLDAATQLAVRMTRARREVRLQDGQAVFSVQADAGRPFDVLAGQLRITVVGTRFAVRHVATGLDAGQTIVAVEEGRVRVQALGSAAPQDGVLLGPGQSVRDDGTGHLSAIASVPPAAIAPWRQGRISFTNATLAQALAEFERYGDTGLVLRDPAVAELRFGGSFDVQQVQSFTRALPQLLPVRLVRQGTQTEIVAR